MRNLSLYFLPNKNIQNKSNVVKAKYLLKVNDKDTWISTFVADSKKVFTIGVILQ